MSEHCPECQGLGLVMKFYYMVPCELCKANKLGYSYVSLKDLLKPAYVEMVMQGEKSPWYWQWLRHMIDTKQIDPNAPLDVSVFKSSIIKSNE